MKKERLELKWVEAGSLNANPLNWRLHPEPQLAALRTIIADPSLGWAKALLFNRRTNRLIDGHGRVAALPSSTVVPVLVGDWSEAAERQILATRDRVTLMAEQDPAALSQLMQETDVGEDLTAVADRLASQLANAIADDESSLASPNRHRLAIRCRSEQHQAALLQRMIAEGRKVRALAG